MIDKALQVTLIITTKLLFKFKENTIKALPVQGPCSAPLAILTADYTNAAPFRIVEPVQIYIVQNTAVLSYCHGDN